MLFKPVGQGWSQVKTHLLEVTGKRVGAVTLSSNFLIEIAIPTSARLVWDDAGKGIFSWRLVKMAVNTYVCTLVPKVRKAMVEGGKDFTHAGLPLTSEKGALLRQQNTKRIQQQHQLGSNTIALNPCQKPGNGITRAFFREKPH